MKRTRAAITAVAAGATAAAILAGTLTGARAQGVSEALALEPPTWEFDNWELRLTGFASGSLYTATQSGSPSDSGATGQIRAHLRLQRTLDTGLTLGARATLLAYSDALSGDAFGNDTFEKGFVFVQTGLGTLEAGQEIGAGDIIGLTGPKVDDHVSLDNPDTTFFRNAATGGRFDSIFRPYSVVNDSGVDAKINYLSPRLFGLQLGLSYTPHRVKAPFPFVGNPTDAANRQDAIWEVAGAYTGYFGDLAFGASASFAHGALTNRTAGFENLYDAALGLQFAYSLGDARLTAGGGYRTTNAYALNPFFVFAGGETHLAHVAAMVETGPWRAGGEFSHGEANGPAGISDIDFDGTQLAAGYRVNDNVQLTAGWQWYDYSRTIGTFPNGGKAVDMNAGFLTLGYTL